MTNAYTLLLTGFGPFPGIPVNASGLLVPRIARAARARFSALTVATAILPTEWQRGPARMEAAIARAQPDIAIHFGVSPRASGFVIERFGVNACMASADGAGRLPPLALLDPQGPARRAVTLPVAAIIERLTEQGLPALASDDAGHYLCNAVLFHSLARAAGTRTAVPGKSGFVHLPACLAGGGADHKSPQPGCCLSHAQVISGSLAIIAACLE